MHRWFPGRVVLLGDAGYRAAPASGRGGSQALIGAYILVERAGRRRRPRAGVRRLRAGDARLRRRAPAPGARRRRPVLPGHASAGRARSHDGGPPAPDAAQGLCSRLRRGAAFTRPGRPLTWPCRVSGGVRAATARCQAHSRG
ncbi:hypothetical protein ACFSTC_19195 [Nonomuraea ferruginea]